MRESRRFGSGWISGVAGVFLGTTALGAVIVLHFPDLLTSADLRARYSVLVIGAAFLCGRLNLLLRRRKALGLTALALTLTAVALGGAAACAGVFSVSYMTEPGRDLGQVDSKIDSHTRGVRL